MYLSCRKRVLQCRKRLTLTLIHKMSLTFILFYVRSFGMYAFPCKVLFCVVIKVHRLFLCFFIRTQTQNIIVAKAFRHTFQSPLKN